MEIMISLDELIADINQSRLAEMVLYLCTGAGLGTQEEKYEQLRVEKDEEGAISLGNELDKRVLDNSTEIYKTEDESEPGKASYEIRQEGMLLLILDLFR